MSAFAKLSGLDEQNRLAVWFTIIGMTRVMDGEITIDQFGDAHGLDAAEKTEIGTYLAALGGMVTTRATALIGAGIPSDLAIELARSVVNAKMMHALLRAEQGSHDEASFQAVFGL